MGADGHISIYSWGKLAEEYGEDEANEFLSYFSSGKMYPSQELDNLVYVTRYWGDNYNSSDGYDTIQDSYDPETDTFNTRSYDYCSYEAEEFMKFPKHKRLLYADMIKFMENKAKINSWEVWT